MAAIPLQRDVEYPYSDGQPMAESDVHRDEMVDLIEALKRRYRDAADVYVAGNLFLYYRQGDPRSVVAPDVFIVRGVPKRRRLVYKLWEEGSVPALVIEVTSKSTRAEDLDEKKRLYESLGVEEYFLHDPLGDYLRPGLQGHRLLLGRYQPIPRNPDGSLDSLTTGLTLRVEGENLRLTDTDTGERLLWVAEESAAREAAEERADREAAARQAAEERAEREAAARRALEEELARLRAERGR
jgi:Uma2 family endonuclease